MSIINRRNRGSKLVYIAVTLMDIILAVTVYACIYDTGLFRMPSYLLTHDAEGFVCVFFSAIISSMIYSTIIHRRRISLLDVVIRVGRLAFVEAFAMMVIVRFLTGQSEGIISMGGVFGVAYFIVLLVSRFIERLLLNYMRRMGHNIRHVVFIGSDPVNMHIYKEIMSSPSIGYKVVGYYSNHPMKNAPATLKHLGDRKTLIEQIRKDEMPFAADIVFTSLSATQDDSDVNAIIHYCDKHVIQFYLVPRIISNLNMNLSPVSVGDYTVFTNHTNSINRLDNRIAKRLFDIAFSLVVCIFLIPLIPIIWIIVKVQSPGPLIFSQKRTGLNGETFVCYKFRSMHVNKDADRLQATEHDPRKFPFGDFMRKTNIDELPQFFNVLKGDMSVVGPRPHMLYHTEVYSEVISKYMVRHFSKPGITGWAQVTGYRGETKEVWQMEERVKRDIWYNENWSFMLDIDIIIRTVLQTISPDKNAY